MGRLKLDESHIEYICKLTNSYLRSKNYLDSIDTTEMKTVIDATLPKSLTQAMLKRLECDHISEENQPWTEYRYKHCPDCGEKLI